MVISSFTGRDAGEAAAACVRVFAPAKINLYLHILGKRVDDGYHLLDSLACFADVGDIVEVCKSDCFSFQMKGPFAGHFAAADADPGEGSGNIVVRAAMALAEREGIEPAVSIELTKNLPLASGIGGGSSDAAAVVRALQELWGLDAQAPYMETLLLELGADVPVCYAARPMRISGIGERLDPVTDLPQLSILLVNPMKSCPTASVFGFYGGNRSVEDLVLEFPSGKDDFCDFIVSQRNDLLESALQVVPEIGLCLEALASSADCIVSRMSGSGATCFGLFKTDEQAVLAKEAIQKEFPEWWVEAGRLLR